MKRIATTLAATALLAGSALMVTAPTAQAGERVCRGKIGAVTVDNLKVPTGASCALSGTRIKGNIKVERGGTLRAYKVNVNGNVQSDGHGYVQVTYSNVGGSIQLKQGRGVLLKGDRVKGDIQVFSNRAGTKNISYNRVDGNLQCKSNTPAPGGGHNVVFGNKEDQCRRL